MANFDRASLSYDFVSSVQRKCCYRVVEMIKKELPKFSPISVLDVGSGTGYLTALLLSDFPNALYTISDISNNMLSHAKAKLGNNVSVIPGDMCEIQFPPFDLIVSSMALHWCTSPALVLSKMSKLSRVFAFSLLVQPSLKEWHDVFLNLSLPAPGLRYLSLEEVKLSISITSPALFTYEIRDFELQFASPKEFMKHMRQLGSNYSPDGFDACHVKRVLKSLLGEFSSKYSVMFGLVAQEC